MSSKRRCAVLVLTIVAKASLRSLVGLTCPHPARVLFNLFDPCGDRHGMVVTVMMVTVMVAVLVVLALMA